MVNFKSNQKRKTLRFEMHAHLVYRGSAFGGAPLSVVKQYIEQQARPHYGRFAPRTKSARNGPHTILLA